MESQNYEKKRQRIVEAFGRKLSADSSLKDKRLKLSWSNWGFGLESLEQTASRLERHGVQWLELHGNRYGDDLGYKAADVLATLGRHGVKVAGVCGMFSADNDLSDNVVFAGPVADVERQVQAMDVMCLVARSEGFSNAILEAMALGARDPTAEEWAFMRPEMAKEHVNVQP